MDRYLGYRRALHHYNILYREDYLIEDRGEDRLFKELALPEDMPTAFVCNNDEIACILIEKLEKMGYSVPEDISVVGYDNYLFPGLCDVAITTYEVDMKEMARQTVHTLIRKMAGEPYRQGICIVEGHMVTKDSVKARKNMG